MSRQKKKSAAVPVVIIIAALLTAIGGYSLWYALSGAPNARKDAETARLAEYQEQVEEIDKQNAINMEEYKQALYLAEHPPEEKPLNPAWPDHKQEGWDIVDLSDYPLDNPTAETKSRTELMTNGLLLLNQWHSRPEDFDDSGVVSIGRYLGGNDVVQVDNYNISLFKNAADALKEVITAAKAEGMEHYIVTEGYRSWDKQNEMFQNKKKQLASKYKTEEALVQATMKEVNYPGTSDFNSGLSFTLRLYIKDDTEVGAKKYSTTEQAAWMNENCWKYGIIFRFPQADWPLPSTQDKSFKTGVSSKLNLYRYVGKGNAAIMHYLDLCLEEYIDYMHDHQHIALFEDGVLKYEIYCQYVGDDSSINVLLTRSKSHVSSLDNMGFVITVFEH